MKEEIKNYFRCDRSYGGGVALVMKYSQKQGLKRQLNVQHESDYMTGIVHEELRQMAELTHHEMNHLMNGTVAKEVPEMPSVVPPSPAVVKMAKGEKNTRKENPKATTKKAAESSPKKVSRKK